MRRRRPRVDADSLHAVHDAIETLAILRGIACPISDPNSDHDPLDALHLAWSISLQIDASLLDLITHASNDGYSRDDISDCLDPHPTTTWPPR